ncbi:hypothetical protein [Azorhizobium doebereinerae]|uniref:hypothetical protein n=1 Tax=Azorhizobium doebereinerae TaxID=281091 RepID=UPI000426366A|nr:hypothetical protein [Azorhizobium doebereinerae]
MNTPLLDDLAIPILVMGEPRIPTSCFALAEQALRDTATTIAKVQSFLAAHELKRKGSRYARP